MVKLAAWCTAVLLVGGCSLFADTAEVDPTPPVAAVTATEAATATEEPTTSPSPSPAPTQTTDPEPTTEDVAYPSSRELRELGVAATCELAGPEFCEDANGNLWPDFVEEELGLDPTAEQCAQDSCAGATVEDLLVESQDNTLFILDASGSMAGDVGGISKMEAAKQALIDYVTVTPDFADLGLMVYGHRGDNSDAGRAESCAGIETFAEIGGLTVDNAQEVVGQFQATGWTPIAASLDAAGPVLQAAADADAAEGIEGATNRIVLISDGIETCDGDPVASAQVLVDLGIQVVVDVIGFDLAESDRAALQQVAETTGGIYRDATDAQGLRDALSEYVAQRGEVYDAINCLLHAEADAESCHIRFSSDAERIVTTYGRELRGSTDDRAERERGQFIRSWGLQADNEYGERFAEQEAANADALAELRAEIDAAFDRSRELEGQLKVATVSWYRCTAPPGGQLV